jgi:hypothetical protein
LKDYTQSNNYIKAIRFAGEEQKAEYTTAVGKARQNLLDEQERLRREEAERKERERLEAERRAREEAERKEREKLENLVAHCKLFVEMSKEAAADALADKTVADALQNMPMNDLGVVEYKGVKYLQYGNATLYEIINKEVEYLEDYEVEEEKKTLFGRKTVKVTKQRPAKKIVQEKVPVPGVKAYYALDKINIKSKITFGRYPQTSSGKDKTPIEWRVVENNGNEFLLVSDRILDCKRYHNDNKTVTWKDSDIRRWLNGEFYDKAFNKEEKSLIKLTRCAGNGASGKDDLPDTEDRVFLLNTVEAGKLGSDVDRIASGTDYAKQKKPDGCELYVNGGNSWWWLRNRGSSGASYAALVINDGDVYEDGRYVGNSDFGVRPALKLILAASSR